MSPDHDSTPMLSSTKYIRPKKRSSRQQTTPSSASESHTTSQTPASILKSTLKYSSTVKKNDKDDDEEACNPVAPIVREHIVERPRRRRPKAATNPPDNENKPLSFNSVADVLDQAGCLPDQTRPIEPNDVVEAELSFACLSPEDYERQMLEEESDKDLIDNDKENDTDDDDGLWDLWSEEPLNEETSSPRPPRAFFSMTQAIAQWITPEAVKYVQSGNMVVPQANTSDLAASRRAGMMAALRMHVPVCMEELQCTVERRQVEQRLGHLLRCLNHEHPTPALDLALTRALCGVLMCQVLTKEERTSDMIESCISVDMVQEEYDYLTQSAFVSFGCSSNA